jgi:hypothetical protein
MPVIRESRRTSDGHGPSGRAPSWAPAGLTAGGSWQILAQSPSPAVAALIVGLGLLIGWRGVDLPAQLYRVASFKAHGFTIWDAQWFGGHYTLNYSVLFPALAGVIGVTTVTIVTAALAALAFERLATAHLGTGGRPAAFVFAVSTVVQTAIGQLPFLTGEALGLCACWAASKNRWILAGAFALGASLTSPLAGAFIMIALGGWILSRWRSHRRTRRLAKVAAVIVAGGLPIAAASVLFPGQGIMPYPGLDFAWEMGIAAGLWCIAGRSHATVRTGLILYAVAATAAFVVPSAIGGNIGRLGDVLALPLAVGMLWPRARLGRAVILPLVAVPLVLSQWGPAWGAMTSGGGQPSTHQAFFAPLVAELTKLQAGQTAARIEVVPTKFHWESVYVAPVMPLARGWERQLDEVDNPLFYADSAQLDDATYRAWLLDNGVRYVALPDAPLDYAGVAEANLVDGGVPGLKPIWVSANWTLFSVAGSTGIVPGPAQLVDQDGTHIVLSVPHAGSNLVRIRYSRNWVLQAGVGCVAPIPGAAQVPGDGTWINVVTPYAEQVTLRLDLLPRSTGCVTSGVTGTPAGPVLVGHR